MNRKKNTTIGLDIAKNFFHYAQLNRNGTVADSGMLKRNKVLSHFSGLESSKVVMEACASSHYWERQLQNCDQVMSDNSCKSKNEEIESEALKEI